MRWAESKDIGVNCRMKAIILQEAYLAMGFPARIVSCTPLDPEDRDSHVITAVWSSEKEKWLWMDPSFFAYPMDEAGELLGIREVRKMLIRKDYPRLNAEAEIRGKPMSPKWYFGTYMMKNLYGLISPLEPQYGYEGGARKRYELILVPGSMLPVPEKRARLWKSRGAEVTQYVISNPDVFWQAP
ncbi:MAG: transglutaminase domain-containing protein [Spirochaetia bacterium]